MRSPDSAGVESSRQSRVARSSSGIRARGRADDFGRPAATTEHSTMVASTSRISSSRNLLPQEEERRVARQDGDAGGLLARYREAGYLQAAINPLSLDRGDEVEPTPRGFRHALREGQDVAGADLHELEARLRQGYCEGVALNAAHVRN